MITKCPHCDGEFEVEESAKGQMATCPDCGEKFEVRDAADVEMEQKQAAVKIVKPAPIPAINVMANSQNLTNCPDCGSKISIEAKSCPHCGKPFKSITDYISGGNIIAIGLLVAALSSAILGYDKYSTIMSFAKSAIHEIEALMYLVIWLLVAIGLVAIAGVVRDR